MTYDHFQDGTDYDRPQSPPAAKNLAIETEEMDANNSSNYGIPPGYTVGAAAALGFGVGSNSNGDALKSWHYDYSTHDAPIPNPVATFSHKRSHAVDETPPLTPLTMDSATMGLGRSLLLGNSPTNSKTRILVGNSLTNSEPTSSKSNIGNYREGTATTNVLSSVQSVPAVVTSPISQTPVLVGLDAYSNHLSITRNAYVAKTTKQASNPPKGQKEDVLSKGDLSTPPMPKEKDNAKYQSSSESEFFEKDSEEERREAGKPKYPNGTPLNRRASFQVLYARRASRLQDAPADVREMMREAMHEDFVPILQRHIDAANYEPDMEMHEDGGAVSSIHQMESANLGQRVQEQQEQINLDESPLDTNGKVKSGTTTGDAPHQWQRAQQWQRAPGFEFAFQNPNPDANEIMEARRNLLLHSPSTIDVASKKFGDTNERKSLGKSPSALTSPIEGSPLSSPLLNCRTTPIQAARFIGILGSEKGNVMGVAPEVLKSTSTHHKSGLPKNPSSVMPRHGMTGNKTASNTRSSNTRTPGTASTGCLPTLSIQCVPTITPVPSNCFAPNSMNGATETLVQELASEVSLSVMYRDESSGASMVGSRVSGNNVRTAPSCTRCTKQIRGPDLKYTRNGLTVPGNGILLRQHSENQFIQMDEEPEPKPTLLPPSSVKLQQPVMFLGQMGGQTLLNKQSPLSSQQAQKFTIQIRENLQKMAQAQQPLLDRHGLQAPVPCVYADSFRRSAFGDEHKNREYLCARKLLGQRWGM